MYAVIQNANYTIYCILNNNKKFDINNVFQLLIISLISINSRNLSYANLFNTFTMSEYNGYITLYTYYRCR